ncbi:MAG: aminotransferase class V-fold PLP-dependent enzyme, partial [Enhydrobacter sp.]
MTAQANTKPRGRQFFNNPGPTNIPDRILRAMDRPVVDFLAPEFLEVQRSCFAGLKRVMKTDGEIFVHASTGHGAWEAAVANVFSPGDLVLIIESGHFSNGWQEMGEALGLKVEMLKADWRKGVDFETLNKRLADDKNHAIKGIFTVHNETATGMMLPLAEVRRAMDA